MLGQAYPKSHVKYEDTRTIGRRGKDRKMSKTESSRIKPQKLQQGRSIFEGFVRTTLECHLMSCPDSLEEQYKVPSVKAITKCSLFQKK
jgi:hypothetical protein